jgi:DNA-binding transcriptional regulator/RsmH inhibitor MraZ
VDAPWESHVDLYGWLPKAPATIEVDDKERVDVPENLNTILDSMEAAAMLELEAHMGRLVFYANTVY